MKHVFAIVLCMATLLLTAQESVGTEEYLESLRQWESDLKSSRIGYLQLAALCRLNDERTTLGSGEHCDCTIEIDGLPKLVGTFEIKKEQLYFAPGDGISLHYEGRTIPSKTPLEIEGQGNSGIFKLGRLTWKIITRGGQYFIRAYDSLNPAVDAFPGFECFPVNVDLIFDADFKYFEAPQVSKVNSRIGIPQKWEFIGRITFEHEGKAYSLDVSENGFTMVRDMTSGDITYGGGRYLYLDLPSQNGTVSLDFNRLYNPPCAFSEYTTCLLPPVQNTLNFSVNAGETIRLKE